MQDRSGHVLQNNVATVRSRNVNINSFFRAPSQPAMLKTSWTLSKISVDRRSGKFRKAREAFQSDDDLWIGEDI
jgi:hypothetical protein